jgi:hypothetical protein
MNQASFIKHITKPSQQFSRDGGSMIFTQFTPTYCDFHAYLLSNVAAEGLINKTIKHPK